MELPDRADSALDYKGGVPAAMASMTLVDVSVVVVGAGVSGLKCAHRLLNDEAHRFSSDEVVVLEAQDRIGGRILTDSTLSKLGYTYDLGAAWFHDSLTNPVLDEAVKDGSFQWDRDGYYDDKDILVYAEEASGPIDINGLKIARVVEEMEKFIEIHYFENIGAADMPLQQIAQMFLDKYGSRLTAPQKQYCQRFIRYFELWDGLSWDQISAKFCILDHNGRNLYNKLGYDFVIRKLAADIPSGVIRKNQQVTNIDTSNSGYVVIETSSGLKLRTKYVVVSVPLSVLKLPSDHEYGISWNPPLPAKMGRSMEAMHFGALGKVIFEFERIWWPDEDRFLILPRGDAKNSKETITEVPAPYSYPTYVVNYAAVHHENPRASLVLLTQSPLTEFLEANPDKAWSYYKPMLSKLCNGSIPDPINTMTSQWTLNPYARGSYLALGPGDEAEGINHFLGSEIGYGPGDDRIRFAGEHTATEGTCCVHGAFMSGIRESEWILDRWQEKLAL